MTTQIQYREAHSGDEKALSVLCGELGYPSSAEQVVERLSCFVDNEDHLVLVAADEANHPVGWVHVFVARRVESDAFAELGGMVVSKKHRGTGIGSELLRKAEEWARSRCVGAIRVRSNVVRERAHRFYERAGYTQTKTSHVFLKSLEE